MTASQVIRWNAVWIYLLYGCSAIFAPFGLDDTPEYCTVYHHLIKSGGTSIKAQLEQQSLLNNLPKPGLCTSDGRTSGEMCVNALHNSTIITGYGEEMRNELAEHGRECEYFTMMRHPIDRLVSAFFYCPTDHDVQTDRPRKWCGNVEMEGLSLRRRLVDFAKKKMHNTAYQTLFRSMICEPGFVLCRPELARPKESWPKGLDSEESWDILTNIQGILSTYTAIGIFEEWELSMQLFDAKVKSPVQSWDATVAHNQGVQNEVREKLLAWAHTSPRIYRLVAADLLVYRFGVSVFQQQTSDVLNTVWG